MVIPCYKLSGGVNIYIQLDVMQNILKTILDQDGYYLPKPF